MADARLADVLEISGVRSAHCLGLIALAGEDDANQAIAIGARVLNPSLPIVARAKSPVAKINLESFGGVTVINPFDTFADNLAVSLRKPESAAGRGLADRHARLALPRIVRPPRGRWLLVGYGRFGHSISTVLDREGIEWKAFDPGITDGSDRRCSAATTRRACCATAALRTATRSSPARTSTR
jgi:Trk K+ transport system NAD-binding subunit